jgi:hypothetical protein
MAGPYSFNGPVWGKIVPTFISWARAPETKANKKIRTLEKITTFLVTTPPFWLKIYLLFLLIM